MSETLETVRLVDAARVEAPRGADVSRDFEAQLGDIQNIINEIARNSTAQASDIATDLGRELAHLRRAVEAGTMSPMTLAAMINSFKQQVEIVRAVANNEQAGNLSQVAESARLAMEYERQVAAEIEGFKRWDPDFNEPLYREARTYVDVFGPELGISPQMAPVVARDLQVISRGDAKFASILRTAVSSPEAIAMYTERTTQFDRTRDEFMAQVRANDLDLADGVRRYLRSDSGYRPVELIEVTSLMQEYLNNPTPENLAILNERLGARALAVNQLNDQIFDQVMTGNLSAADRVRANRDIAEYARVEVPIIGAIQINLEDGISDVERNLLFRRDDDGMSYVERRGAVELQNVLARTQMRPEELFDPETFFDDTKVTPEERAWITLMRDVSTTRAVSGVYHFVAHARSREGREIFDALARSVEEAETPQQALAAFEDLQRAGFLPEGADSGVSMGIIRQRFMDSTPEDRRAFMGAIRIARDSDDPAVVNEQVRRATELLAGNKEQTAESFRVWAERQEVNIAAGLNNTLEHATRNRRSTSTSESSDEPLVQTLPMDVTLDSEAPLVNLPTFVPAPDGAATPQRDDTRVGGAMDLVTESPLEAALRLGGFSRFGSGIDTIANTELRAILVEYDASVGNRNGRYSIEEVKEALRYAGVTDITVINANGDNVVDQAELLEALRNVPQRIRDGSGPAVA